MRVWLEGIVGADNADTAIWALAALAAIIVLYLAYVLAKRLRSGTYVAGGRNRKARLAIMDATAIDTHRRLVLVRRDDVEHLLLIGGHSDIVVERDIRLHAPTRRPVITEETHHNAEVRPAQEKAAPVRHETARQAQPSPAVRHAEPPITARPATSRPVSQRPVSVPPPSRTADELDNDLLKELESALDTAEPAPQQPKTKPSLDEEMAKLLGELSSHKR
ncbi:MAG: flagellar biosynthetic protein FliO [Rhizobiaceae bacterium]|nr:flagellar biosynthetic protein FliO [Rhizobiaceae bacterium]